MPFLDPSHETLPATDAVKRALPSADGTFVRRPTIASLALLAALGATLPAASAPLPEAPACTVFPEDNPWNRRVDNLPVHRRSRAIVRSIGRDEGLHPDFGSGTWEGAPIGIPYAVVDSSQEEVPIDFTYADESDPGPYPIPADVPIEGGADSTGDRHVIVVNRDTCTLYELFAAYPKDGGSSWDAGSGAIWDLTSNDLRPRGWTSADAAGLPILPGLARFDEVDAGIIDHALRFTVSRTRRAFVYPARHYASSLDDPNLPAMGQRLRLKKSFDISGFPEQATIILRTLKRYGMLVADNGSDWFITGVPNEGWDNDALHSLQRVKGRHFEVVKAGSLRPAG
jgi:hypothetical protein